MKVVDMFTSIQGEGPLVGRVCYFIRLAGCNLKCEYCDQKEAWSSNNGTQDLPALTIAAQIPYNVKWVVITGGEPTIHMDLPQLINTIKTKGYLVQVETNGSYIELTHNADMIVVSPKMFGHSYRNYNWLDVVDKTLVLYQKSPKYYLKFVISSLADIQKLQSLFENTKYSSLPTVYIQPLNGDLELVRNITAIAQDSIDWKLFRWSFQIHKHVGVK